MNEFHVLFFLGGFYEGHDNIEVLKTLAKKMFAHNKKLSATDISIRTYKENAYVSELTGDSLKSL